MSALRTYITKRNFDLMQFLYCKPYEISFKGTNKKESFIPLTRAGEEYSAKADRRKKARKNSIAQ